MGAWQYDDADIERLSMIMTLHDIGFKHDEITHYMRLLLQGASTRMRILKQRRDKTLDEIHFQERGWTIFAIRFENNQTPKKLLT